MNQPIHKDDVIILGFHAHALEGLGLKQGFNPMYFHTLAAAVQPHLIEDRRGNFENDPTRRHFIPYLIPSLNDDLTFAYQRGKGVGESRLAGGDSIGLGGHVDDADFVRYPDQQIDLGATLMGSACRELTEEVSGRFNTPNFLGVIVDDSDEVGKVHLGIVMEVTAIDPADDYHCKEPELITHGFRTVEQLAALNLESWSRILLEQLLTPVHPLVEDECGDQAADDQVGD